MRFFQILQTLYCEPWLIGPDFHSRICQVVEDRMQAADPPTREPSKDICGESIEVPGMQVLENGIAIIPVNGVIANGLSSYQRGRGMVDSNDLLKELSFARTDEKVKGVFLDIDSPGGMVQGTPEVGDAVAALGKPSVAFTGSMMASAAYWIGAQADAVFASKGATVGSVGVYMAVLDQSRAMDMQGLNVEVIKSGKFKAAGSPFKPLSETDREYLQDRVNEIAAMFKREVTRKRMVKDDDMQGQAYIGDKLKERGFIDAFLTRESAMNYLVNLTSKGE